MGNFLLENGKEIRDCRIGYRTFGKLNTSKSNVVVFPTAWGDYSGRMQYLVAGRYVDTSRHFLILIDAFANGVSSSPSNSASQAKTKFPQFSIRDLVKAQYKFLTEKMNIRHVSAIAGFSMGGMQAFQWSVSYPEFMDKIITIEGTPVVAPYDLLWTSTYLEAVRNDSAYQGGNYQTNPVLPTASRIVQMVMSTPDLLYKTVKTDSFSIWLAMADRQNNFDQNDLVWQVRACMTQDISFENGGKLEEAAKKVKAKFLIITNKQDHTVNPQPSIRFAGLINAKLIVMDSEMGHIVLFDRVPIEACRQFLENE
jgi:homoserine O-acetyltransferase